ncbi:hypothetical protein DV737_g1429, partial [Chaetothyriales sp. CBS 132003]
MAESLPPPPIPILLLKTCSTPTDAYQNYFTSPSSPFSPTFLPVLTHHRNPSSLSHISSLLHSALLNPIIAPLRDILGNSLFNPVVLGQECGNGEALANFLLREYNGDESRSGMRKRKREQRRRLLFLVGEQRRDVIPRTLMDEALGENRVEVEEMEVYRTDDKFGIEADACAKKPSPEGVALAVADFLSEKGGR